MAGLGNKFWKGLREWDVLVSETWMDEKGWIKVREKLPRGYGWVVQ